LLASTTDYASVTSVAANFVEKTQVLEQSKRDLDLAWSN